MFLEAIVAGELGEMDGAYEALMAGFRLRDISVETNVAHFQRHHLRQQLYSLSQRLGRTFRVCHLPPYCSKYNPIDHRLFCHLSRSLKAIQLTSIEIVRDAMTNTTTRTGLRVVCELATPAESKRNQNSLPRIQPSATQSYPPTTTNSRQTEMPKLFMSHP